MKCHLLLLKQAKAAGCTVKRRRNGHLTIVCPNGKPIFTSATPSDWRAIRKIRAQLRREGVKI